MWPRSSWLWLTLDKNVHPDAVSETLTDAIFRAILPFSLGKMTPQFTRQVFTNLGSTVFCILFCWQYLVSFKMFTLPFRKNIAQ